MATASKVTGCISHVRFSPKDIKRLEERASALNEEHDFPGGPNDAYIEAASRIATEARDHKENILGALTREDAAKAKADAAPPVAPPVRKKFDNLPDLADSVAKEQGYPQAVAQAYVEHVVLGRSMAKIAETLGVGKSTAHEMVAKMRPLMDEAKATRLEEGAGIEPAATAAVVENPAVEEPAPDQKADVSETDAVDDTSTNTPAEELTASGDVSDEDNQASGQGPRDEGGHVNISDAPHGEGETKAKNDEQAERAYKRVNKDTAQARWDSLDNGAPKKSRVAWSALGPGQKAGFADEAKKGKAAEAYASIAAMHAEGIRLQTYPQLGADPPAAGQYDLSPIVEKDGEKVAAVLNTLTNGKTAPLVGAALKVVKSIATFAPRKNQDGAAAMYNGTARVIALNENYLSNATLPELARTLVHESVHAVDAGVSGREASTLDHSPTLVALNVDFKTNKLDVKLGPVIQQVLVQYSNDQARLAMFDQALWSLDTALAELKTRGHELGTFNLDAMEQIADTASVELTPKLMELYLASPQLLRTMPLAYAHAEALAKASTVEEARQILGGTDAKTQSAGPDQRVPQQVQVRAQNRPGAEARPVPAAAPAVGDRGQGAPRPAATGGQGRASELNVPPPITGGAGVAAWLKAQTTDALWRNHPGLLGWLSTEQLADRWKDIPLVKAFSDVMRRMEGRATQLIAESDKHSTQWSALRKRHGPKNEQNFGQLLIDSTTAGMWPDRSLTDVGNKHLDAKDGDVQAEHAALQRAFNNLPAAYKTLYKDVIADKEAQRAATIAGLRKGIVEAYHPDAGKPGPTVEQINEAADTKDRAAFAKANVKTALDDKAFKALWTDIDAHAATFPAMSGPYFPKMRFGDHIVSYKSAAYQAAEAAVTHANEVVQNFLSAPTYQPITELDADLKSMEGRLKRSVRPEHRDLLKSDIAAARAERENLMQPLDAARRLLTEQQNKLMLMKAEGEHYGVEFYENRALALANEARLRAHFGGKGTGTAVSRDTKDQFLRSLDGVTPAFMRNLEDRMSSSLNGVDAAKVRDAMRELYIRLQPENSALKRQLKRANVSGVRADEAQRAYATSSLRSAHSISRLEHGSALRQHVNDLRFGEGEDAKLIGNELGKRIAQNMATPMDARALTALTNMTYLSYLGMSPSFMVTQITQPWVISAPLMAGRHGVRTTGKLLAQASVDAAKLLKGSFNADKRWKYHLDPQLGVSAGTINADEAKMLQELMDHGRIDITITHDLGATSSGSEGGVIGTAAAIASYPAQQLEMANRVSTALAGYRAERSRGTPHIEAMAYADGLVADSHLNYAAANRARHMHATAFGGWGRVMFQFRAYQQGMLYLIYKNMVDGARGNPEARRSLAYLAGMQLATAGLAGMPVPGVMAVAVGLLYKAFTDDDDEKDLKEMLFQGVASAVGETGATAVMKGIPAALGVDLSAKVGMGNIAEAVPYADERAKGKDIVKDYFSQLVGGPALGMAMNWFEAAKAAGQGDFLKATAQAAPAALAGPLKAVGYATHGMVDSRGNTILAADEMSAADTVIKALGFQPTEVARVQDQRRAFFEARGNRDEARHKLLSDYAHARMRGGDLDGIREDVDSFNSRHPDYRITYQQLEKSVASQRVRERSLRHGIPVGKHDAALAEELGID